MDWAIGEINREVQAGRKIDFVVYTGDLGLENVLFPDISNAPPADFPRPFGAAAAVNEVALELEKLLVKDVFFVAGNNDLLGEQVTDMRYEIFVNDLIERSRSLANPHRIMTLTPAGVSINGFQVVGMNSASFKKTTGYEACKDQSDKYEGCPKPQFDALNTTLRGHSPVILFTHIPDLKDPYLKETSCPVCGVTDRATSAGEQVPSPLADEARKPAWALSDDLRAEWEKIALDPKVIGIFAGHFHDPNRAFYASNNNEELAMDSRVALKTWVAPPLAIKFQDCRIRQARGLLFVTVSDRVERVQPRWLYTDRLMESSSANIASGRVYFWLMVMFGLLFALATIACFWLYWRQRKIINQLARVSLPPSTEPRP